MPRAQLVAPRHGVRWVSWGSTSSAGALDNVVRQAVGFDRHHAAIVAAYGAVVGFGRYAIAFGKVVNMRGKARSAHLENAIHAGQHFTRQQARQNLGTGGIGAGREGEG